MTTATTSAPALTWSHSRDETFGACLRRYYHRYYGGLDGWRADAPAHARHTYRLTQLTSLDQVLGISIHTRAREIAAAVVRGRPRPGYSVLLDRTRADLNRICRNSKNLVAFARDPKRHPVLLSVYYGRGLGQETVDRIRTKAEVCLRNLVDCSVWSALEGCSPESVHVLDTPGAFEFEGTLVWAIPDLVYSRPGRPHSVVDWKTGRPDPLGAFQQLRLYGCFLRDGLGLAGRDGYEGQVVELAAGRAWTIEIAEGDLHEAEARCGRASTG